VQAASIGTVYLVGEVVGALVFGRLSDKLGRRNLFMWTLAIYLVGTGLSALAMRGTGGMIYFYATRFIADSGIGGEYSAVNSAIDEMMPARYRGRTDIWINGSYWLGSIIGTLAAFLLLNSLPENTGWRVGFLLGPVLAIVILIVRRNLPESPRWLLTHGRVQEAEESMKYIEDASIKDLPGRDPGLGHRGVFRRRPDLRRARLDLLRRADRHRLRPRRPDHRLPDRRRRHDHRRAGRGLPRNRRRGQAAGAGRTTAHRGGLRGGHALTSGIQH